MTDSLPRFCRRRGGKEGGRRCSTRHSLSHQSSELRRSGLEARWRKSGQEKSTQPSGTNKLDSCIFPHGLNPAGVCLYTCAQITERLACNVCDLRRGNVVREEGRKLNIRLQQTGVIKTQTSYTKSSSGMWTARFPLFLSKHSLGRAREAKIKGKVASSSSDRWYAHSLQRLSFKQ